MKSLLLNIKNPLYVKVLKDLLQPFFEIEKDTRGNHIADFLLTDQVKKAIALPAKNIVYMAPTPGTELPLYITWLKTPMSYLDILEACGRDQVLLIGASIFHPAIRLVRHAFLPQEVSLTEKETDLLMAFVKAQGPVTRSTLVKDIWGYSPDIASHTFETNLYRLRQKIMCLKSFAIEATGDGYELIQLI